MAKATYRKSGAKASKSKIKVPIIVAASVVVVAAAGIAAWLLLQPQAPPPNENLLPIVDESNMASIQSQLEDKVEQGMFETHFTNLWTFPDGESPSMDAVLGNAAGNRYSCWYTVALPTGEEIFSSSMLPVGTVLETITLSKDLDAGTYPAVLSVHMVDENQEVIDSNMASFNITIVVQA